MIRETRWRWVVTLVIGAVLLHAGTDAARVVKFLSEAAPSTTPSASRPQLPAGSFSGELPGYRATISLTEVTMGASVNVAPFAGEGEGVRVVRLPAPLYSVTGTGVSEPVTVFLPSRA